MNIFFIFVVEEWIHRIIDPRTKSMFYFIITTVAREESRSNHFLISIFAEIFIQFYEVYDYKFRTANETTNRHGPLKHYTTTSYQGNTRVFS